jgi:hypothetical protein
MTLTNYKETPAKLPVIQDTSRLKIQAVISVPFVMFAKMIAKNALILCLATSVTMMSTCTSTTDATTTAHSSFTLLILTLLSQVVRLVEQTVRSVKTIRHVLSVSHLSTTRMVFARRLAMTNTGVLRTKILKLDQSVETALPHVICVTILRLAHYAQMALVSTRTIVSLNAH